MSCAHCGAPIVAGQVFCSKCGQTVAGMQAAPAVAAGAPPDSRPAAGGSLRVSRHITALGIIWIVYSALRAIPGIFLIAFGHWPVPFLRDRLPVFLGPSFGPLLQGLGVFISAWAIAGIIAGCGLLGHQPWARILAIVLACVGLIHFPLGTALGIYTLWVLVPQDACSQYRQLASRA